MKEKTLISLTQDELAVLGQKYTGKHLGIINLSRLGVCEAGIAAKIGKTPLEVAVIIDEALRTLRESS